ncbi:hypothetical protein BKA70DRAFT_1319348 [Coprinopsis sp. MPI-PUGE-AT-0042]|nr:hypothetical protein BKA70DRAFT_1319348 [Coprinopsis sp. MPI-PUGE-AT-0042]
MHSTRFQLKILDWNCPLEPSDEQFVQVFLRSQRQLERVILTSWNSKDPISMPGLRNVWAHSTPAAMALVTGNSVRTLRWNPDLFAHTLPAAFPPSFLESFRGITTLTIGHHPDLFPTLVEYLDNVRILEICGSQERQPDIGKLVHRVPHLEELTLTSIPTPTVDKALIKDIFRRGRKLRTIYVRPDTVRCMRWDRTSEEGIPAPNHNFYSHLPWRNCGLDEVDFPWEEIEKSR